MTGFDPPKSPLERGTCYTTVIEFLAIVKINNANYVSQFQLSFNVDQFQFQPLHHSPLPKGG